MPARGPRRHPQYLQPEPQNATLWTDAFKDARPLHSRARRTLLIAGATRRRTAAAAATERGVERAAPAQIEQTLIDVAGTYTRGKAGL